MAGLAAAKLWKIRFNLPASAQSRIVLEVWAVVGSAARILPRLSLLLERRRVLGPELSLYISGKSPRCKISPNEFTHGACDSLNKVRCLNIMPVKVPQHGVAAARLALR